MEGTASWRSLFVFPERPWPQNRGWETEQPPTMSELTIATFIFLATYAVIISERLDRTVAALTVDADTRRRCQCHET